MVGGVGSGKSYTIGDLLVKFRSENKNQKVFIGANSYKQLRDSTMQACIERLQYYGFNESHYDYQETKGFFNFMGMECVLRTLENVDKAIAGLTVDKMVLDEYAFCGRPNQPPMYIHKKIIQRLRGQNAVNRFYALTSPNGINFLHDIWVNNRTEEHYLVQCKTKDNIFLPDGYYDSLVSAYGGEDSALAKQELFGQFINVQENSIYYAFDRERHVKEINKNIGTFLVGMDFNVEFHAAIVAQYVNGKFYVVDEIVIENNSDTYKMCGELIKRGYRGAKIYPDHTGKNRKTSGKSDFMILKNAGFTVERTHNPIVFDRTNNVNRHFIEDLVVINPKCKWLIRDLELVKWRGGKEDQITDPTLSHASSSLGYLLWKLNPITAKHKSKVVIS